MRAIYPRCPTRRWRRCWRSTRNGSRSTSTGPGDAGVAVSAGGPRVLISGTNRLAAAIEEKLRAGGATIARLAEDPAALTAAGLAGAAALVLASDDDAGNVDMALTTRRLRPDLPLVIRLFDPELAAYVRATLRRAVILSLSGVAAPAIARETVRAMGEGAVHPEVAARAVRR